MAPCGLMFDEVTASSLVKVDMQGQLVDDGSTMFGVDSTAVSLHVAAYSASSSIMCVIHISSPAVLSVCMHCLLHSVLIVTYVITHSTVTPYWTWISQLPVEFPNPFILRLSFSWNSPRLFISSLTQSHQVWHATCVVLCHLPPVHTALHPVDILVTFHMSKPPTSTFLDNHTGSSPNSSVIVPTALWSRHLFILFIMYLYT